MDCPHYWSTSFAILQTLKGNLPLSSLPLDLSFRCQNLDLERELSPVPRAMVNLETWLPTNFQVGDCDSGDWKRSQWGFSSFFFAFEDFSILLGIKPEMTGRKYFTFSFSFSLRRQQFAAKQVNDWKVKDVGRLGPGGRWVGDYIPFDS